MNYIDLLLLETRARFQRAWEDYHQALMSAHENLPDAPNLLDCIAEHVLDFYCRSAEDLQRVERMHAVITNR